MNLTSDEKHFIQEHAADDLNRLLLAASRYPGVNVPFLVDQIAVRRQLRDKLPAWAENEELVFPARIAAEQCSSEQTAVYKQQLVDTDWTLCDLTGGLGVDSYYLSRKVRALTYVERYAGYCEAARHNFEFLGADNVTVVNADATEYVREMPSLDAVYLDPARRGESNKRLFALHDCEPGLPALLPSLLQKAHWVIAKLSPMADLQQTFSLLPGTTAVHVLSVRNECKELLFVIGRETSVASPAIHCVNFLSDGTESAFTFTWEEERTAETRMATSVGAYLYEPHASLLKAGAFKLLAVRLGVEKLQVSSHLYTSQEWVPDFPGRSFRVEAVYPFSGKLCKTLARTIPQANITVRNFPLSVAELRRRTKIAEGGSVYLFATTLADGSKVVIACSKLK